jgi:hypothetical protein
MNNFSSTVNNLKGYLSSSPAGGTRKGAATPLLPLVRRGTYRPPLPVTRLCPVQSDSTPRGLHPPPCGSPCHSLPTRKGSRKALKGCFKDVYVIGRARGRWGTFEPRRGCPHLRGVDRKVPHGGRD